MLLEARDVTAAYGTKRALGGVSLSLAAGETLAILGPNGSGKTTLFRLLLGLITPGSGELTVLGAAAGRPASLARIGATLEIPSLYGHLSALENLEITAHLKTVRGEVTRGELVALLSEVGLADTEGSPVATFSLGMRQRLAIAEALIGEPQLLILDEPTNGLDPEGIRWFREWLARAVATRHLAVVFSSHILTEVALMADRLLVMKDGRVRFSGSVAELRGPPETCVGTRDIEGAAALLAEHGWSTERRGDLLYLEAQPGSAPDLARLLVGAGHDLLHLASVEASLEERYLAMLQDARE